MRPYLNGYTSTETALAHNLQQRVNDSRYALLVTRAPAVRSLRRGRGRNGGRMMIDDHPMIAFSHIGETEPRGIAGGFAVLSVGERVGAAVQCDLAKDANVLLAQSDALVGPLWHRAEILAPRRRCSPQGRRTGAQENCVRFVQGEDSFRIARVEGIGPVLGRRRNVIVGCRGIERRNKKGDKGEEKEKGAHGDEERDVSLTGLVL